MVVYHLGCYPIKCATTTSEIDSMGQMRFKYAKNYNNHDVNYIKNNNGYNVQVVYPQPVLVRLTWAMFNLCVTIVCFRRLFIGLWLRSSWMVVITCSKFGALSGDASVGVPCAKSRHATGGNPPTHLETPCYVSVPQSLE